MNVKCEEVPQFHWTLISRLSEVAKQGPAFFSVTDQSCVSHAPDIITCSIYSGENSVH